MLGAITAGPLIDRRRCLGCKNPTCIEACNHDALMMVGDPRPFEEILKKIKADLPFYRNSGGGVTFSGGEPLLHLSFLASLLEECKKAGIHTAVETCGMVPLSSLQRAESLVDLFLYDVKGLNPNKHREWTGQSNAGILDNLRWLATKSPEKVVVRLPIIPGYNATLEVILEVTVFAKSLRLGRLDLIPYHPLGIDKAREMGIPPYIAPDFPEDLLREAIAQVQAMGVSCEIP
jgi:pyruvate formate lyase activating enzyme